MRIQNAGLAHTVSIYHDPAGGAGDPTAEALDVVSTNPLDTTVGVHGREEGRGTVKITHEKPAGPDANASALSICLIGNGTAAQGIYIGNDAGIATTGPLLNIRNGGPGSERLVLTADGRLDLPVPGPQAGLMIGSDASLYRSARQMLATAGGLEVRTLLAHQSVTISVRLANPPAPTAAAQARMYVKGAKLVVQWNNGSASPLHDDPAGQLRTVPRCARRHDGRQPAVDFVLAMASTDKQAADSDVTPQIFTVELTLEEMAFLRLILTNATVQPAELKKLCGEVQAKIEAHIGPLPQ